MPFFSRMHTPVGTLERDQAPPTEKICALQDNTLSLSNKDDRENFTNRYVKIINKIKFCFQNIIHIRNIFVLSDTI